MSSEQKFTVWQRLSRALGPDALLNQDFPTYKFDRKELLRTTDKAEYEKAVTWGEWAKPIWPVRSTAGSIPTPYIFDDRLDYAEIVPAINKWYKMSREERNAAGLKGREWMLGEGKLSLEYMCKSLSEGMEAGFANWKPRKKYELFELV